MTYLLFDRAQTPDGRQALERRDPPIDSATAGDLREMDH